MLKIFIISLVFSLIFGKIFIPILKKRKVRQAERDEGPKTHFEKEGTPTMGGIFIILAIIATYICILISKYIYNIPFFEENINSITMLLTFSLIFGLIGFIDDYLKVEKKNTDGLSAKAKMLLLTLISIIFVLIEVFILKNPTIITIPFLEIKISINIFVYIILSILVILSTPNAINLTDGIDGLATSVGSTILFYFFIVSIFIKRYDIAIFILIILRSIFRIFSI